MVLAAGLGFAVSGSAQESRSLSLDDAINIAKANNPLYLSTANDVDDATWQVREAYGQFLPSFSIRGGAQRQMAGGVTQFGGGLTSEDLGGNQGSTDYLFSSYSMQLSYNISGNTFFQARSARANSKATNARVNAAGFFLESAVTVQYLAALRAGEEVEVAQRQIARLEESHELVSGRVAAGAAPATEGKVAEVDLGRAQVTLLQAQNLRRAELARLMEQMGSDLGPSPNLVSNFQIFEPTWNRDELLGMAISSNPGLQAVVAEERAAGARVNQARSGYFPTVSAQASWSGFSQQVGNESFLLGRARGSLAGAQSRCEFNNALGAALPQLPGLENQDCGAFALTPDAEAALVARNAAFPFEFQKQPLTVGVSVTLPIFQGFSRQRQIAQAKAQSRDSKHNRTAAELRLRTSVTQSYDDLTTAYQSLQIQRRNLEVAGETLELASQRYALGAAPFLELLDAEDSLAQAERDELAAVYNFHQAMWALEASVGQRLRPTDLTQGNN